MRLKLIVGGPHTTVTVSHRTEAARGAGGSAHPAAPSGDPREVVSDVGQPPSPFLSSRASDTSWGRLCHSFLLLKSALQVE